MRSSTTRTATAAAFAAAVLAPIPGPAARLMAAGPITYVIAPGKGQSVRFEASTGVEKYAGRNDRVNGDVTFDPERPAESPRGTVEVRAAAFTTGNGSRDSKMRRKHLDVDRFTTVTFTLSGVEPDEKGPLTSGRTLAGALRGRLTLHGVTRDVRPTGSVTREPDPATRRDSLRIRARFVVNLSDYDIPTPGFLFVKVKQEHPILVDVRAVATAAP